MKFDKAKIRHPVDSMQDVKSANRPSVFTEGHRGEYYNVDINKLIPFDKQSRKYFDQDALIEMAETIKAHGIRQPLTIIADKTKPALYQVVSGERRLRSAQIAGLSKVPCIIIHDYKSASEIAIIENIQREDLHPLELAKAYAQLLEENICTSYADIAKKIGTSKSVVTEILGLLKLPQTVQEVLLSKNVSNRDFYRELFKMQDATQMIESVEKYYQPSTSSSSKVMTTSKPKRKILLKVVLDGDQIHIDTNRVSAISKVRKQKLLQELNAALGEV
jgi:ParB family chromosome partitioning protein